MMFAVFLKSGLSRRESEVADLVRQGLKNADVAQKLFVTEKTVKFHLTNIFKKLGIKSRSQLIVWCLPHLSFEEKTESPPKIIGAPEITIPVGISKIGSA